MTIICPILSLVYHHEMVVFIPFLCWFYMIILVFANKHQAKIVKFNEINLEYL